MSCHAYYSAISTAPCKVLFRGLTLDAPRNINQLGSAATTLAAQQKDHVIRQQYVQKALHMIPWMALKTIASN